MNLSSEGHAAPCRPRTRRKRRRKKTRSSRPCATTHCALWSRNRVGNANVRDGLCTSSAPWPFRRSCPWSWGHGVHIQYPVGFRVRIVRRRFLLGIRFLIHTCVWGECVCRRFVTVGSQYQQALLPKSHTKQNDRRSNGHNTELRDVVRGGLLVHRLLRGTRGVRLGCGLARVPDLLLQHLVHYDSLARRRVSFHGAHGVPRHPAPGTYPFQGGFYASAER